MELANLRVLGKVMRIRVRELHIYVQLESTINNVRLEWCRKGTRVEGNQHLGTPETISLTQSND